MRIGIDPGPGGIPQHQSSYFVYEKNSGVIVGTYHFVSSAPKEESDHLRAILKSSHEASGISLERLAVLTNPDIPTGEGELHVEHETKQLARKYGGFDPRVQP